MNIPFYLQTKLAAVGIVTLNKLKQHNYLVIYQWLRDLYPSLSRKALFDVYCLIHELPLNSLSSEQKQQLLIEFKSVLPIYVPLSSETIDKFMQLAVAQAKLAIVVEEIPIGAVIVKEGQVIGYGYNQTRIQNSITAHAEIMAITMASDTLANHRLTGCDLYVTIEPCLMCMGAIIHSRIKRVIFGAVEPQTGAIISQYQVLNNLKVNAYTEGIGPLNNVLYSNLLQEFLRDRR